MPGEGTFYRTNQARPSVLDLTLSTEPLARSLIDWQILPNLGSDHLGIAFMLLGTAIPLVDNPIPLSRFDTKKADWKAFAYTLNKAIASYKTFNSRQFQDLNSKSPEIPLKVLQGLFNPNILDLAAEEFTSAIISAANKAIPKLRLSARSKPWWEEKHKILRKALNRAQREAARVQTPQAKREYNSARNCYLTEIKRAKISHWNAFLEKEDP
jgi:hypothetical protein